MNLRKLLYSESKTDHQGRERIITLSVHAFVALYPRFQSIYDLEEHFQRRTKSGALKTSLISEIVQWVEQKPDWVQSRVEVILQLTAELETLVEKFKKAHSPDAFKELVKYVAALIPPGEVFLYALDETHVLDCLAGTTRVDQPRILVREDPILAKNIEVGNAVLNNYDDEVSYFRTVIPLVMIGKLEPTTIGAIIIKTASEIEFSDLLFLSILLPRISRSALELIAIDRERKLTDLNVGLDYLQHQFRKPANNISDLLKLMSQMPEIIKTEKLKQRFETLRLMSDYSIFTSKRIESSIELDRGTYVLQVDQLDLLSLVREILEMLTAYHYPVREKSKKITLLHSSPCVVPGDAYLIKLAAGELIENAMRYAMEEITLKVVQNETYGFIEVSDDGKRSERDEKRYFKEPFSSEQGGTGKGLPFVKRVAEKHEGTYGYVYRDTKVFFIGIPKHSKLTESE
ncbi:MAG: HAMP domain-containing histidine kinase [Bacteroidetes bacterium]|nr:HAMP domain-containing histidine kinase [Bacteroidota bacterium]MCL5737214.1 HAMP domain-containing histidine kinase [Bacteroidota bacterium]